MAREINKVEIKEENGSIIQCYEIFCSCCGLKNVFAVDLVDAFSSIFCSYCRHRIEMK